MQHACDDNTNYLLSNYVRIRRAGYPIRHSFHEFVERYRVLIPGLHLSEVRDFKSTSKTICNRIFVGRSHDWQIGYTKVFLKVISLSHMHKHKERETHAHFQDADDQFLEDERDKILTNYVILIQKWVRGWFLRRRFLAMKKAALVLQKNYRRRMATRRWRIVSYPVLQCQIWTEISLSI